LPYALKFFKCSSASEKNVATLFGFTLCLMARTETSFYLHQVLSDVWNVCQILHDLFLAAHANVAFIFLNLSQENEEN
jgi:hypothetical protein